MSLQFLRNLDQILTSIRHSYVSLGAQAHVAALHVSADTRTAYVWFGTFVNILLK